MKKIILSSLFILSLMPVLSGCSGGGGGSSPGPAPTPVTTAILKIANTGILPAGTLIGGVDVTVVLPAGVTVQASPDAGNPAVLVTSNSAVAASGIALVGSNMMVTGTYTAATSATRGKVVVKVVNPNGFGLGEFATITCNIAAGNSPSAGDFSLADYLVSGITGGNNIAPISSGVTPGFTADIH